MPLDLVRVEFEKLYTIAQEQGAIKYGAVVNLHYQNAYLKVEGYRGTMYYAKTANMKIAENHICEISADRLNIHHRPSIRAEPGYVYVIKGRRYDNYFTFYK